MKIFVTRKVPGWDELSKPLVVSGHELVVYPHNKRIERHELEAEIQKGYDGLVCLLTEKIDTQLLAQDADKKLRIIVNYAVGYDNIDIAECAKRGIVVANTPSEVVNESVAEFTWSLMLMLAKNLQPSTAFAKNVGYHGWEPDVFLGMNLKDKTLAIIGTGRIGSMVQKKAEAFGMNVVGFSRGSSTPLEEVLGQADVVTLHVPLTDETRHLICAKTLAMMRPGVLLINTARGPVVDEADLVVALQTGQVGGAALDVWENEPSPRPEFVEMENVILSPHVASATHEARTAMGQVAIQGLVDFMSGKEPINVIKIN